ncbi:MAG: uroporphyrinogen-III C-methyltransferase [Legionellales bacterium]|nr:uroporphyrinogen-III C-methyltransferase [Legionellales bacterium]
MINFPIFIKLQDQECLVVGGGAVAARKIKHLLNAGAKVSVVSPTIQASLEEVHKLGKIDYFKEKYCEKFLEEKKIVVAATNNAQLNYQIAEQAKSKNIFVNVADNPEAGTFIIPSIVDRSPIIIAISTSGIAPVLTRLLSTKLETVIPSRYGELAKLISSFRGKVKEKYKNIKDRRRFWENILNSSIAEMFYAGQEEKTLKLIGKILKDDKPVVKHTGEVYLVGGGPGDPELLTFRALRLMQQSDVVLYDRLISPKILDFVRKDAERIYVGKKRDRHTLPQSEINQLLVDLAKQGKRVLRLKGGDPFMFGRGGEEIDLLNENEVSFQIVPGITAASGCASYAGIPLTHRDYAQSCLFVTGHLKDGSMNLNWQTLVQPQQTIAVYMGTHSLSILSHQLMKHGMKKSMPAAIIQQGTTGEQSVFLSTIELLPELQRENNIKPPSMIIIGEVVSLHEKLAWYKSDT